MEKVVELDIDKITELMEEKLISKRELADKCLISEVMMCKYLNGDRVPAGPVVVRMADVLGVGVNEILRSRFGYVGE